MSEKTKAAPTDVRNSCPDCHVAMRFVFNLCQGTDTGYGWVDLYQCDTCKRIEVVP